MLSAFRQWLLESEQWRTAVVAPFEESDLDQETDLHSLLAEMLALKQEVRLESRGSRATRQELDRAVGEFRQGIDQVQEGTQRLLNPLMRERDRLREDSAARLESQQRAWAENLLDIREALARGEETSRQVVERIGWRRWFLPRGLFGGLLEGYSLALKRLDAALESRDIRPIECLGQKVDPETMRVVDVVRSKHLPAGHVAEVLRRGYTCGSKLIRYAEVRAVGVHTTEDGPSDANTMTESG